MKTRVMHIILYFALLFSLQLSGCSIWSDWESSSRYRELPYSEGQVVKKMYRLKNCAMCTSGGQQETAFFRESKKYEEENIGEKVENIVFSKINSDEFFYLGKTFSGKEQYFISARIIVPSIDPLVLAVVPWKYKTKPGAPMARHDIFQECEKFSDAKYINGIYSRIALFWPEKLRNPIEFRRSFPKDIAKIRIISDGFDKNIEVPSAIGERISIDINNNTLSFILKSDGMVLTSYEKLQQ